MTLRNKFIITAILLLLSLVAGSYLSGFILLQWLGLDKTPLVLTTWFKYFNTLHLPRVAAYSLQIKTSGIAGFGLPLLAYLFSLVPIWRTASPSLHGEARFSELSDLSRNTNNFQYFMVKQPQVSKAALLWNTEIFRGNPNFS